MNTFVIVGGLILLAIVFFLIFRAFIATQFVPEERRLVIYRLGRFNRIAGPGPVQFIKGLEEVSKSIDVRTHPVEIEMPGVMAFGVWNKLTLSLWYKVDLKQAAGNDRAMLLQLVQIGEAERRRQIEVKMLEAVTNEIAVLENQMPLEVKNKSTIHGIMAIAPGSERYNRLREGVKKELENTLPTIGVFLDSTQPIVLTQRDISNKVIEALERGQARDIDGVMLRKYADQLRDQFPKEVSGAILNKLLASIEGVDGTSLQHVQLDQDGQASSEFRHSVGDDGSTSHKVVSRVKPDTRTAATDTQPATDQPPEHLTADDLAVLKRLPRNTGERRLSA